MTLGWELQMPFIRCVVNNKKSKAQPYEDATHTFKNPYGYICGYAASVTRGDNEAERLPGWT